MNIFVPPFPQQLNVGELYVPIEEVVEELHVEPKTSHLHHGL